MNFVTYKDLNTDIISNMHRIPKNIDVVVGIPRSGLLVANIIALYLNKPLCDFDSFLEGKIYSSGTTKNKDEWPKDFDAVHNVLIVEDSVCSGNSIKQAKNKYLETGAKKNLIWFAAYVYKCNTELVDLYLRTVDLPRAFEWNYLHITNLSYTCFDIDGILCEDPTEEQNDDGEKYREFLLNAPVKFLPTKEIGCIVTSRLEKYRTETEFWLKKYNIRYKKLFMMNIATAEERRMLGNHASFKANIYKEQKNMLFFIESEDCQAQVIAEKSGKTVFCPSTSAYYEDSFKQKMKVEIKNNLLSKLYPFTPSFILKIYRKIKYHK